MPELRSSHRGCVTVRGYPFCKLGTARAAQRRDRPRSTIPSPSPFPYKGDSLVLIVLMVLGFQYSNLMQFHSLIFQQKILIDGFNGIE